MAHIRQKHGLGPIGLFRLFLRRTQFGLYAFQVGDIVGDNKPLTGFQNLNNDTQPVTVVQFQIDRAFRVMKLLEAAFDEDFSLFFRFSELSTCQYWI